MNAQKALFDQGMRPVVRSLPSKPQWKRLVEYAHYSGGKAGKDFAIHFSHKISSPPGETLYFAFCPPHSYGDCLARLGWLDSLFDQPTAEVAYGRAAAAAERAAASSELALGLRAREAAGLAGRPGGEHLLAAQRAALEASADLGLRASHGWKLHAELASASAESAAEVLPSRRPTGVYYRRELLTYSVEGRRVDLITISGHTGIKGTEPPLAAPLLPQSGASPARRPSRFPRKRALFITSRVHPGETPASFVLDGLLTFLLRESDPRAIRLRANFVFKIIPMLNPDGVFEGKFRTDTVGANLNRMYARATHEAQPSIYAALAVARELHSRGELFGYVDIHAHAGKRGCFLYGNLPSRRPPPPQLGFEAIREAAAAAIGATRSLEKLQREEGRGGDADGGGGAQRIVPWPDSCLDGPLFARLVALNSPFLDFDGCVFYEGDGRHGEKGGSGREAVYAATGLDLVFTLECNYNSGKTHNYLPPRFEGIVEPRDLSPPRDATRSSPKKKKKDEEAPYTVATWRDVGKALALASIDFIGVNPASRAGQSPESGCAELKRPLWQWLSLHSSSVAHSGAGAGGDESEGEEEEPVVVDEEELLWLETLDVNDAAPATPTKAKATMAAAAASYQANY